ncbi:MAG: cupin domain-containing protein [Selenomonadaceae bacterium]|nr:cupin domain-containing protein [Selenomonadaceae bacterium]MBR1858514.1 cupin domain-containing protein [Selenomonadaceae bacterium]
MIKNFYKKIALIAALATMTVSNFASAAVQTEDEEVPVKQIERSIKKSGFKVFPIGKPNVGYAKYFTGKSYLYPMENGNGINVANVTFEPGCINNWHIHHGTCQILVGVGGVGWYQIWGQEPQKMTPGVSVTIPEGVKHWHGASKDSWFQHLSIMQESDEVSTEWLEPVDEAEYAKLK